MVLLGMQPRRMHRPPTSRPPSTSAVRSPSAAAVRAAENPALPPPMTTKSYEGTSAEGEAGSLMVRAEEKRTALRKP